MPQPHLETDDELQASQVRPEALPCVFQALLTDVFQNDLTRKISITVPLNDDTEYEGGQLEFRESASPTSAPRRAERRRGGRWCEARCL